jgi:hypothetical protein
MLLLDALYVNVYQSHRLVTHEDRKFGHLHKILGFGVLAHYLYRFYRGIVLGSSGLVDGDWVTLSLILMHAMLHVSSFQFIVPVNRNMTYNVIWAEMRWHTLLFAYRAIFAMIIIWGRVYYPALVLRNLWVPRAFLVMGTMAAVDFVTKKLGTSRSGKTIRDNPWPSEVTMTTRSYFHLWYSMSQAAATYVILSSDDMMVVFMSLFPIQLAPFLMTLVKKGVMRQAGWHFWYVVSLLIPIVYTFSIFVRSGDGEVGKVWTYIVAMGMFYVGRLKMGVDKYVLWTLFSIVNKVVRMMQTV